MGFVIYTRHMTEHLKNLWKGASTVLVLRPGSDYVRPTRHETHSDNQRLVGDAKELATDMRRALKYGEQIDYRQG
jgi:hypothetical protein